MSTPIASKGEWFGTVSRLSRTLLDFFSKFSERNKTWFRLNGGVKAPVFKIEKKQRSFWSSENPMRAFWPQGLAWFPETQKNRQGEYLYYVVDEQPNNLKPKYINKHPHVIREALQLIADLLDRKTPIFCLAEKLTLKISKDGHLVVLPNHKVIFNPSNEVNYADIADISKVFPQDSIKKAREYLEVLHQVCALLKDSQRKAALAVLASHGVTPTPRIDPADQELDLCGVETTGQLAQRLADHPKYQHLVQDEYGEIRDEIILEGVEDNPLLIKAQEILAKEQIQQFEEFNELASLFDPEDEQALGQNAAELMDWSELEQEKEDAPLPSLLPKDGVITINGIDFTLTERDLQSIYANHLKSTEITCETFQTCRTVVTEYESLEITSTKWECVQSICPLSLADESYQRIYDQHFKDSVLPNWTFVPTQVNHVKPTKDDWRMKRLRQEDEEEQESRKRIKA
jgi:hypothetical protein